MSAQSSLDAPLQFISALGGRSIWRRELTLLTIESAAGPWAAGVGAFLTLACLAGLATQRLTLGSYEGHWIEPYFRPFSLDLVWPALAAAAITALLGWGSAFLVRRREWLAVAGWLIGGLIIELLGRWYARMSLGDAVVSDVTNSFYSPTLRYGALDLLQNFNVVAGSLPLHARSNMPGKIIFFDFLELLTNMPELLGLLVMVASSLGGLFLYLAVRDLFRDRRTALYALALYMVVPAKVYFFPILNTVSPTLILGCFLLYVRYLRTQNWLYAVILGTALYILLLFEPLPLAMGILFLVFLVAAVQQRNILGRDAARLVGLTLLGFAALYGVMRLVVGYDLLDSLAYVLKDAERFNAERRPYAVWVRRNLRDFAFGAGIGADAVFAAGVATMLVSGALTRCHRWLAPEGLWAISVAIVLVLLDVLGMNRGEVIRLWIFLACFVQVVPAWLLARTRSAIPFTTVAMGMTLQASLGASMVAFVKG